MKRTRHRMGSFLPLFCFHSLNKNFNNFAGGFIDRRLQMTGSARIFSGNYETVPDKKRIRIAVASFYFSMGLMFASWASRIPDIKTKLHLNDAVFGTILFAMPAAQFLMMTFSGKLVTRFGSRKIAVFALPMYSLCLCNIGR